MATLAVDAVRVGRMPGQYDEPDRLGFPIASSQTYTIGALLVLSSGALAAAAANVNTNIVGIADHDAAAIYAITGTVPTTPAGYDSQLFGSGQFTTKLLGSSEWQNAHALAAHNNQPFEISLLQAWATSLLGTTVGINIDGTSGYYIADNTQSNKPATIIGKVDGPNKGGTGDVYARVLIVFSASSLAL